MNHLRDLPEEETTNLEISEDVIAVIASKAAVETKGVAGMSTGIGKQIANMLGREYLSKGIKVSIQDNRAFIEVYVIIRYGFRIPEVAWEIQNNVKRDVETMTETSVEEVNIHIQSINSESI
jgi:uncharacterized alkaline shock family protein YloU